MGWLNYISDVVDGKNYAAFHIAVFTEPFLQNVLDGTKTIESRFSSVKCAPFRQISNGDIILIKQSGGPVRALSRAIETTFFNFSYDCFRTMRELYGKDIGADEAFWSSKSASKYGTIVGLSNTISIEPVDVRKSDRRGWVSYYAPQMSFTF